MFKFQLLISIQRLRELIFISVKRKTSNVIQIYVGDDKLQLTRFFLEENVPITSLLTKKLSKPNAMSMLSEPLLSEPELCNVVWIQVSYIFVSTA